MKRLITLFAVVSAACGAAPQDARRSSFVVSKNGVTAEYDKTSGRLKRIELDQNSNGRIDTWSYWDGTRVERIDVDKNEDGRIERWEHYDGNNQMVSVGSSSRDDGVEDTWSYPDADGLLMKTESDTNRDGRMDKREVFGPGIAPGSRVLKIVDLELDETGTARRRLHYRPDGSFEKVEVRATTR